MNKLHIKKDDTVVVISGDSKGTQGKVIVAGANIVSKHTKARRQGETSSIVKTEGAIYACKVQLVCPECKKGVRVKYETVVVDGKKTKKRLCAKCGAEIK